MKHKQNGFSIVVVLVAVLLAFLVGGTIYYLSTSSSRRSIDVDGQSFSLDSSVQAEIITLTNDGKTSKYFRVTPGDGSVPFVATIYVPTASNADLKDTCKYTRVDANILSKKQTVCNQGNKAFIANFDIDGKWYQVAVFPEDRRSKLQQTEVIKVMESISNT